MSIDGRQSTAIMMCQILLRQMQSERNAPLNGEDIASVVDQVIGMQGFKDIDKAMLIKELEERFTVYTPIHGALGSDDNHVAWLPARRNTITWRYWDRYKIYLDEMLPPSGIESVDKVTDDILQRLEDPQRPGIWDRRGLVMGHVQSGKTANYCGLICKAADVGYKVIIILSGIHNSLRSQTQIRLDEGFLGFMSQAPVGENQSFRLVGVGTIDRSIVANTATNRTEHGDFNRVIASQFGIHPGGIPLIFITKKNVSVLKNLNNWILSCANAEDSKTQRRFILDVPALVIDDEADLASIDTRLQAYDEDGNPDPEHDPTETNKQIRRLLRAFEKVAYVGYTATPFANIYIYDRGFTPKLGDDLFPRSFIISIPAPSNYIGPARVFGITEDEDAGLEEINPLPVVRIVKDHAETLDVKETRGWMPPRLIARTQHDPRYGGIACIPPSLREAVLAFILATATRTLRRSQPLHNTMLVHVVRYTKVQARVASQIESALKEIVQRLRNGDGSRKPTMIDEFRLLWTHDFEPTTVKCNAILNDTDPLPAWDDVETILLQIASSIKIKIINGSAGDVLDYEENKDIGMNVIAIGGDKLSRGLTLEGLTVSYFLRASRMYDTLMQMGRWFGYREHYTGLCRLYTTAELLEWFTHITAASEELQNEFKNMVSVGGTPKDYGLKIRSHPALLITSAVKMRHGTEMRLSFSGDISETIIFKRDPDWITHNFNTSASWLSSLLEAEKEIGSPDSGYTWNNIPAEAILEFLRNYNSHEDARRADTELLSKYIRAQNVNGELVHWTVRLCSSQKTDARESEIGGMIIHTFIRSSFFPSGEQQQDRYTIRRLVSPVDEMIDLDEAQKTEALDLTRRRWLADPAGHHGNELPERPGGREIRQVRLKTNGLILLYPLKPPDTIFAEGTKPIIAIALSFPKSDTAKEITYKVNNIFTQQGGDDDSL